jgi:hypothetical protein
MIHHESQPEKRRRPEASALGQPPPSKTAIKQVTASTPTKTNSSEATTGLTHPVPSTVALAIQAPKSGSNLGKVTTEPSSDNLVDSTLKAADLSFLKPPQAHLNPLSINGLVVRPY